MSQVIRPQFDAPPSSLLAYLRLMRLPNVFTAAADIAMGFLFVHHVNELAQQWPAFVLLIVASSLIYTAGMILNDVFDVEIDRQERPFRPLPSGQISVTTALRLGCLLLLVGVVAAAAAGWLHRPIAVSPWRSGIVAAVLALAVLGYDAVLKNTPLGPLGMGLCRLLNVLLGMSLTAIDLSAEQTFLGYHASSWIVAAGIGVYITGVTWFARSEATESNRGQLVLAALVIAAGIAILPQITHYPHPDKPMQLHDFMPYFLFAILALPMARRALVAIQDPQPENVQAMVKHCILSLIVLDAAVTFLSTGPLAGLLIALLMAPMFVLGRWVYST